MRDGVDYPAMLFTVFDGDTRVDPLHARKMCAALQHATGASLDGRPILLRRETDVGHGARAVSPSVELSADMLAFLAAEHRPRLLTPEAAASARRARAGAAPRRLVRVRTPTASSPSSATGVEDDASAESDVGAG